MAPPASELILRYHSSVPAPIFVTTSDKYLKALRPFAYLLNKYWVPNPQVIVGGFEPPDFRLPKNFFFQTLGPQDRYPLGKWSNGLHKLLTSYPHDIFILMLEDYWITRPVDTEMVEKLYQYMVQFAYVMRMDLTADRQFAGEVVDYDKVGEDIDLVKSTPFSPYHMSLMTAVWRKKHFLSILRPDETPWDLELKGTQRLSELEDQILVLGTKQRPVRHTLAFRGGDSSKLLLDEVSEEDQAELRHYGLLEGLE